VEYVSFSAGTDHSLAATTQDVRQRLQQALDIIDTIPVQQEPTEDTRTAIPVTEDYVRSIIRARRQRANHFDSDLFADPAWDILLDLYAGEISQRRSTVSSACIAAAVPATTALRWIGSLEARGLIQRRNDPLDGRRVYISLTAHAVEALSNYFAKLNAEERAV
jgi:DNA-binding MarR family transcriptional regulator